MQDALGDRTRILLPRRIERKNTGEQQELIFQRGINWNDYAPKYKRGRMIVKETYEKPPEDDKGQTAMRTRWVSIEVPIFTQERNFLNQRIPNNF